MVFQVNIKASGAANKSLTVTEYLSMILMEPFTQVNSITVLSMEKVLRLILVVQSTEALLTRDFSMVRPSTHTKMVTGMKAISFKIKEASTVYKLGQMEQNMKDNLLRICKMVKVS